MAKRKKKKLNSLRLMASGLEVYIYDDISKDWGFSATDLITALQDAGADASVDVHINSAGGEIYEGLAIYNALMAHRGEVTTIVDGVAASMASIIFLAGDDRIICDNAMIMVHNPMLGHLSGDSKEIEATLELLKKTEANIKDIYAGRTGQTLAKVQSWLDKGETYFSAAEAVQYGFAMSIEESPAIAASASIDQLVLTLKKRKSHMNFTEWLTAYCEPLGLDLKKLTADQKKKLKAMYMKQQKSASKPTPKAKTVDPDPQPIDPDPIDPMVMKRKAIADEFDRTEKIQAVATKFGDMKLNEDYVKDLGTRATTARGLAAHAIREGWSVNDFELHLHRGKFVDVGSIGIHSAPDRTEINVPAMSAALCRQAGVPASKTHLVTGQKYGYEEWFKQEDLEASDEKRYRNLGLHQMMDMAIYQATGSRYDGRYGTDGFIGAARDALWKLKMAGNTTWTGLNVFDDAANKMLWAAYNAQNTTWQEWVPSIPVADFKTYNMYRMTMSGGYQKVGADGELKHGGFSDDKYTVAADTYGKIVGLSRRDIINDDLNALNRIMTALGTEGARFLEELFYGYFLNVRDTLFPSAGTYNNYISGAATALGVDALTTAEQKFSDQVDSDDAPLLVNSELILCGTALAITANELYKQVSLDVLQTANTKGRPNQNPHIGKWRPVVSPYINNTAVKQRTDALGSLGSAIPNQSATQWWLMPAPNQALGGVITGAFLNGNQRPVIEQGDPAFDVLGLQWRAYHDAGVGSGDPKLAVYSKGAA